MSKQIYNNDIIFLISTPGDKIDISPFINNSNPNIIHDPDNKFSELELINSCAMFKFKDHAVDTLIEISNDNLMESMTFFSEMTQN